jgi:hypothetical protein
MRCCHWSTSRTPVLADGGRRLRRATRLFVGRAAVCCVVESRDGVDGGGSMEVSGLRARSKVSLSARIVRIVSTRAVEGIQKMLARPAGRLTDEVPHGVFILSVQVPSSEEPGRKEVVRQVLADSVANSHAFLRLQFLVRFLNISDHLTLYRGKHFGFSTKSQAP